MPTIIYFVLLGGAGALFAALNGYRAITLDGVQTTDLTTAFLTAVFVSLVIERAVEVFVNARYEPERSAITNELDVLRAQVRRMEAELKLDRPRLGETDQDIVERQQTLNGLRRAVREQERHVAEPLRVITNQKTAFAAMLSMTLGLAAAVVGVRMLGQFLPVEQTLGAASGQITVFRFVDVVLTTALLAGGAKGIHTLVSSLGRFRRGDPIG